MYALTLIQPWAYAIASLGKDIENRTWVPPGRCLGQRIAIHAGAKCSADAIVGLSLRGHAVPHQPPSRAVVATALLVGWARDEASFSTTLTRAEATAALRSPWYIAGQIAWVLRDAQPLRVPVPCKGALGLWRLPFALTEEGHAGTNIGLKCRRMPDGGG